MCGFFGEYFISIRVSKERYKGCDCCGWGNFDLVKGIGYLEEVCVGVYFGRGGKRWGSISIGKCRGFVVTGKVFIY